MPATKEDRAEFLKPLEIKELVFERAQDIFCSELRRRFGDGEGIEIPLIEKKKGLRARKIYEVGQIVVPSSLRSQVLHLSHRSKTGGNLAGNKLYHTLRKLYYWPSLALDGYGTAPGCTACAQNRMSYEGIQPT